MNTHCSKFDNPMEDLSCIILTNMLYMFSCSHTWIDTWMDGCTEHQLLLHPPQFHCKGLIKYYIRTHFINYLQISLAGNNVKIMFILWQLLCIFVNTMPLSLCSLSGPFLELKCHLYHIPDHKKNKFYYSKKQIVITACTKLLFFFTE